MSSVLVLIHCQLKLPFSPLPFLQLSKFLQRAIGHFLNCDCRDLLWSLSVQNLLQVLILGWLILIQ